MDNPLTRKMVLDFSIVLWSIETRAVVKNHLEAHLNLTVSERDVQLVPIEKNRLTWIDRSRPLVSPYQLIETWHSATDLPSVASFQIYCQDTAKCTALRTAIKTNPKLLYYGLDLLYLTNPMGLGEVTVTGAHMARSGVYSEMARMPVRAGLRYATSDVADTLATQTVAAAVSSTLYTTVTAGDELSLTNALKGVLKFQQVSTRDFTPAMWNSLFWKPVFSRPDKIAIFLNTVLENDPNDTTHFLVDERHLSESQEHRACADDIGLTRAKMNLTKVNNSVYKVHRETVLAALRTKHVEWTGERFRARQMSVYRLNLAALNSSTSLVSGTVRVREFGAVKRVKVRAGNVTVSKQLTPELVEARLKMQMQSLETALKAEMNHTRVKADGEFNQMHSTLQTFNQTMANQKRELNQATTNLGVALNQTTVEILNSTLKRIANVFYGWPEYCRKPGHYCNVDYYLTSSVRTAQECMKSCDASARCQGFNFFSDSSTRCRLLNFICPYGRLLSKSTRDHYIKLTHVPIVTTEMWKSVFTNNSLVNIPSDPCHMVGEYYTYTRV